MNLASIGALANKEVGLGTSGRSSCAPVGLTGQLGIPGVESCGHANDAQNGLEGLRTEVS